VPEEYAFPVVLFPLFLTSGNASSGGIKQDDDEHDSVDPVRRGRVGVRERPQAGGDQGGSGRDDGAERAGPVGDDGTPVETKLIEAATGDPAGRAGPDGEPDGRGRRRRSRRWPRVNMLTSMPFDRER
jgi:hypothetical protein